MRTLATSGCRTITICNKNISIAPLNCYKWQPVIKWASDYCKVWVAMVFCVARTHLARPDLGSHAHVRALQFFGGRTSHPHLCSILAFYPFTYCIFLFTMAFSMQMLPKLILPLVVHNLCELHGTYYVPMYSHLPWLALFLKTNGVKSFFSWCKCIFINKDWENSDIPYNSQRLKWIHAAFFVLISWWHGNSSTSQIVACLG